MSERNAVRRAVERELSARGYDNYPADQELYQEAIDDVTSAVLAVIGRGKNDDSN